MKQLCCFHWFIALDHTYPWNGTPAVAFCFVLLRALEYFDLISPLSYPPPPPLLPPAGPGPTQEELRRKVENGVKEFWYFVRSEVKKLSSVEPIERQKYADSLLQDLGHQERWACSINTTNPVVLVPSWWAAQQNSHKKIADAIFLEGNILYIFSVLAQDIFVALKNCQLKNLIKTESFIFLSVWKCVIQCCACWHLQRGWYVTEHLRVELHTQPFHLFIFWFHPSSASNHAVFVHTPEKMLCSWFLFVLIHSKFFSKIIKFA